VSQNVSFFDLRARNRRRDELVESAIEDLRLLKPLLNEEVDLTHAIQAIEAIKKLRRPEVVAEMHRTHLRRITGEPNAV
jgi:hypothetical protein